MSETEVNETSTDTDAPSTKVDRRPNRELAEYVGAALIAALIYTLISVVADFLAARVAPIFPASLIVLFSAFAATGAIGAIALRLYLRQSRAREWARRDLQYREREFFVTIDEDVSRLLAEELG